MKSTYRPLVLIIRDAVIDHYKDQPQVKIVWRQSYVSIFDESTQPRWRQRFLIEVEDEEIRVEDPATMSPSSARSIPIALSDPNLLVNLFATVDYWYSKPIGSVSVAPVADGSTSLVAVSSLRSN